jgi:predicted negative regulator of RcsB-dependent stress response
MAFTGKNELSKAKEELQALTAFTQDSTLQAITIWDLNSADQLVEIAWRVLQAEILPKQGDKNKAVALLKEAVDIEDKLNYNEPPDCFFP